MADPVIESFPPIGEYAFLSDCHTGALVAADGSVEWLCLPRFDSPSVFGAILDRDAGGFRFAPSRVRVPVARRYVPGTNVLETTWMTPRGWVVVRDALVVTTPEGLEETSDAHYASEILVRHAKCTWGDAEIELSCRPVFDYGRHPARWRQVDGGLEAELPAGGEDLDLPAWQEVGKTAELRLRLVSDLALEGGDASVAGSGPLSEGEECFCALSWGEESAAGSADANELLELTEAFWRRWLEQGNFPDHRWRIHLQRSALTLKGLVYEPTGAIVAAPTTSLPETPGGERNWDYRFSWVRDATFALWGLHILGFNREARDFVEFVVRLCGVRGRVPQIMFGIEGEHELDERTLDHLSGYDGARPVRIGNAAWRQRQNDVYGALLDSVYIHTRTRQEPIAEGFWEIIREQVDAAVDAWAEPDRGIWEVRGEPQHFVSSKLMCWVALDRGVRLGRKWGTDEEVERWGAEAEKVRSAILDKGVSERGVFRQHFDTDALDASSLLVPLVRFLPPDDERVRATVEAIAGELTENGLVLRYRTHETDDGVSGIEGTFAICSFWLVSALSEIGERERARQLCERLLSLSSELGLYAEEIEPASGTQLGNFPQAFTHLGLINAVSHVIADDQRGKRDKTAVFSEMRERGAAAE